MAWSVGLAIYLVGSRLGYGTARNLIAKRLEAGKEDPLRYVERLGEPTKNRPNGPLIWVHAASVGESVSILDLIGGLLKAREDLHVLVTTGTVTSAEIMEERLPDRAFHQFVPIDAQRAVKRFLDHWQPDVAVWTESELWPALIHYTHRRGCPMFLVNGRISQKSTRRLRYGMGLARSLLSRFERILAQDEVSASRFFSLGAAPGRLEISGSLKESATPLPVDENELKSLSGKLSGKQVWLAASTHPGEEVFISQAHRRARRLAHGLILILVPRHPERGNALAAELRAAGWRVAQRSNGEKFERDTDVYLADTLGELGLWYRLAPVSLIGGSFVRIGGHNPYEPAMLGSAIMHGPHVENFASAYAKFSAAGATVLVPREEDLGDILIETLPADRTAALAAAGWRVSAEGLDVAAGVRDLLLDALPEEAAS